MNAWELALKAYIQKNLRKTHSIFLEDGKTISLSKALTYVNEDINKSKKNKFTAIQENLFSIEEYRNQIAHFYCSDIEPCIFSLVARCALNFVQFIKEFFGKDIINDEGLFIMPIGFKLPFNPEEFFSTKSTAYSASKETKAFLDKIIKQITTLKDNGIEDSIVLGFDVYLNNVKKPNNSDLLVQISKEPDIPKINLEKKVTLTDDPNAQKVSLTDEELRKLFPLTYKNVLSWCKENISNFKQAKKFNDIMKKVKDNKSLRYERKLDPYSAKTPVQNFYSNLVLEYIKKEYEEKTV
jgi:hypothetical protein